MYNVITITGKVLVKIHKDEADRLGKVLKTREPRVWDLESGGFLVMRNIGAVLPEDETSIGEMLDELESSVPEKTEADLELETLEGENDYVQQNLDEEKDKIEDTNEADADTPSADAGPAGGLETPADLPEEPVVDEGDLCECGGTIDIRKKTTTNGVMQFRPQCTDCGKKGNLIKKDLIEDPDSLNELV